jgi:hypothetical protein
MKRGTACFSKPLITSSLVLFAEIGFLHGAS